MVSHGSSIPSKLISVEFAFLVDLDNDGKARELLPQFGDQKTPLAWYEAKNGQMVKHVVQANSHGHGIGAGDVNKDGRNDARLPKAGSRRLRVRMPSGPFIRLSEEPRSALCTSRDVNGDGRNDVITSNAHDYGLMWFEQGANDQWTKHLIDDSWSQAHAVSLIDSNGDGKVDILTGKRFMAHNGKDPGERESLGVYWYEQVTRQRQIEWVRHVIDYGGRTGGGMQIPVADLDGDGDLDFAVAGKSGLFLFLNKTKP